MGSSSLHWRRDYIVANTAILRAFARLPKLRRAPGPQGELKYVMQQEVVKVFMQEDWGSYWFFPTSMFLSGVC